jgi:hypothetical protein
VEHGLFSRLQSYFHATYGGRYVEYLIKASVDERPKLATVLFGVKASETLHVEYRFKVGAQKRIADLAFVDARTERPTCLIEIKYDDHKSPTNAAQIEDYLKFCNKVGCRFILLSQHCLPRELLGRLPTKSSLQLFSDLASSLKDSDDSVGGLLRRFFVDRGLVMNEFKSRDLANLKSFVFRLFNPWGGQGRSHNKDAMDGGAAEAFGNLLKNMNIVAKEVATNESGRPPTIDFFFDPWINPKRISKEAGTNPGSDPISAAKSKAGGYLFVYGRIRLDDTSKWLQIEFGVGIDVTQGSSDLTYFSYANIYSYALNDDGVYHHRKAGVRILYDKEVAVSALKERIEGVIDRACKRDLPKIQIAKLKRFKKNLN